MSINLNRSEKYLCESSPYSREKGVTETKLNLRFTQHFNLYIREGIDTSQTLVPSVPTVKHWFSTEVQSIYRGAIVTAEH